MRTFSLAHRATAIAGASLLLCGASLAQTGTPSDRAVKRIPISRAVAQLQNMGINVILKGSINPNRTIPFSLSEVAATDADPGSKLVGPGARLQAINAFVNALGGDFRKVYVISKLPAGAAASSVKLDTNAQAKFKGSQVPVAEAIRTVAGLDAAYAQIAPSLSGTVTFSAPTLSANAAANEIARQTGTRWKLFYAVARRDEQNLLTQLGGDGPNQPISPYPYFRGDDQRARQRADAQREADAQAAGDTGQQDAGFYNPYAFGTPGLGFNNDPFYMYQSGPAFNGLGQSYQNTVGGYSPGGFSTGGGLTVLNGFPNFGGYGGPVVIGGY